MSEKYPRGVEIVASALIVRKDGKILLIKSHKWNNLWLLPGGHVEPGETILEAAKREGEEETGLKLKPLYCVNFGELINDPDFNRKAHLIYFHCVCESLTEDVVSDQKELKEFAWFEPDQALHRGAKKTIENYMKGIKIDIPSNRF
jgi:nucleoside triphosphatase